MDGKDNLDYNPHNNMFVIMGASRDAEQLTDYLDALEKIGEKIVERWNGKN